MPRSHAVMGQDEESIDQYEAEESPTCPSVATLCSVDWELLESKDRLGCARGVVWALVFEAALAIAAGVCWQLHLFPHWFVR